MRQNFPASAEVFDGMREEESGHRRRLIELGGVLVFLTGVLIGSS